MRAIDQFFDEFSKLALPAGCHVSAHLQCEQTDFVRFNGGKVRQSGHVDQATATVELVRDQRHACVEINLGAARQGVGMGLGDAVSALEAMVGDLPADPHLLLVDHAQPQHDRRAATLVPIGQVVDDIATCAQALDLVGILAHGPLGAAYCDSNGLAHSWQRNLSHFDYSVYAQGDKAFKRSCAAAQWDGATFAAQIATIRQQLPILFAPPKVLPPQGYRAWLTPAAVSAVTDLLCWNGFSAKAQRTRQSHLQRLVDGSGRLDQRIAIAEDLGEGMGPPFGSGGFAKPAHLPLIRQGQLVGALHSPRTAREYGVATDGCGDGEEPNALTMAGGDLQEHDILKELDTGLWVDNLWYLNFSDRDACRMTGMTRFATLWVQDGVPVAPVTAMRFDDTLERMFGSQLLDLGAKTSLCVDALAWKRRSTRCSRVPGVLLRDWTLTL
ncbi:MAG: TldD/PmbA family protein [Myxococcales bacterium]|nr:TldD/PmbA family protein [Myxococcales bacterium]